MHRDDAEDLLEDAAADFVGDPLRCLDVVVHVHLTPVNFPSLIKSEGRTGSCGNSKVGWRESMSHRGAHLAAPALSGLYSISDCFFNEL